MPQTPVETHSSRAPPDRQAPGFPPAPRERTPRGNVAIYRIALQLPKDAIGYVATHGRPDLRVELMNRMELGDGLMMIEARVFGPGSGELAPLVKVLPSVVRLEVHPETDRSTLYRIIAKTPALWKVLRRHRILTRYPVVYVDGWMRFETLAPPSQVRQLVKDLVREVGPSRVESVRQGSVNPSVLGLTPSQQHVFREALASGYFGSPRRASLTQLAKRLGRSKSTVSEQIALIQRRLAESALRLKWEPLGSVA